MRRGLLLLAEVPEEVELAGDVVPRRLGDGVDDRPGHLHEGAALIAHGVKRPGLDEVFDGAAVELLPVHAAAEVLKVAEGTVLRPLLYQRVDGAPAYALDGDKAVADVLPGDGEVCARLVHVRGQELDAYLPALGNILGHLGAVVED